MPPFKQDFFGTRFSLFWWGCWILTLLSAGLRFFKLNYRSLWIDEMFTWYIAKLPTLWDLWIARQNDFNPPLFDIVSRYMLMMWGNSDFVLRILPAIAGVMTTVLFLVLGRRLVGERAALLAATLWTFTGVGLHFSQEARPFSIMALLALLFLWAGSELATRARNSGKTGLGLPALMALSGSVLIYTHYSGIFYIAGVIGSLGLLNFSSKKLLWRLAAVSGFIAVSYIPWMATFFAHSQHWPRYLFNAHHAGPWKSLGTFFLEAALGFSRQEISLLIYILSGISLLAMIFRNQAKTAVTFLLVVIFFFGSIFLVFYFKGGGVFFTHHAIVVLPPVFLFLGTALERLFRSPKLFVAVLLLLSGGLLQHAFFVQPYYQARSWQADYRSAGRAAALYVKASRCPIAVWSTAYSKLKLYVNMFLREEDAEASWKETWTLPSELESFSAAGAPRVLLIALRDISRMSKPEGYFPEYSISELKEGVANVDFFVLTRKDAGLSEEDSAGFCAGTAE